jgi:hypothetical protein
MVDEDGGWSAGAIGAVAGGVIGGVAGGIIANKNGGGFWGTLGGALGGALLGAGIGYAADMTWFNNSASQSNNFFTNFRAFYGGLLGKEAVYEKSTIGKMSSGYGNACPWAIPIDAPNIWGGIDLNLKWSKELKWVTVDLQYWINQDWVGVNRYKNYQIMDRTVSPDAKIIHDEILTNSRFDDGKSGNPTNIRIRKWDDNRTTHSSNISSRTNSKVRVKFTQDASNTKESRRVRARIKTEQLLETGKERLIIMGIKIPFIKRKS